MQFHLHDNADTYWTDLRNSLNINNFVHGLVDNAADQGTVLDCNY